MYASWPCSFGYPPTDMVPHSKNLFEACHAETQLTSAQTALEAEAELIVAALGGMINIALLSDSVNAIP